ncbi:hypothetical protein [Macrococcoides caseolyticum]|uniref:hypothetical protein n=1 Tax=Macrococcoides caseolyticum TaxID=69966 RepID=UPI001F316606|nr:hypothetical protein [Macrococcus caseolyticus]MCE4956284.1 hypothetical protein [Macrococcus caseolyticus]
MLSNEAEHFLLQLRLELASRGKKDEDIDAIEEELRDHLYEAELRGESVESVTGGSVKEYIKSISNELPFDKGIFRFIFLLILAMISFFTVPNLIQGDFDMTVNRVIYYSLLMFVLAPLELWVMKTLLVKYGDRKKSYGLAIGVSLSLLAFCILGEFLLRKTESPSLVTMDDKYSFYIGITIALLFIIICAIIKYWFFIGVMIYIVLPDLLAKLFTSGNPKSEDYVTLSGIIFTVLNIVFGTMLFLYYRKEEKKDKVK